LLIPNSGNIHHTKKSTSSSFHLLPRFVFPLV
jgi:hypothetical protein